MEAHNNIHCKVIHNDDIRRFIFVGRDFKTLKETIAKFFSLNHGFVLRYLDDEDDYVNLENQNDLMTALEIAPNLLRLKIGTVDTPASYWKGRKHQKKAKRNSPKKDQNERRTMRAAKKLSFIDETLSELSDDSKLTPYELKRKQRLLRKKQKWESIVNNGPAPKRERRVLTPEEKQFNSSIRDQMKGIRTEVRKIKERQRELKLLKQNNPQDKAILDELAQLKEKKAQFKVQRRSLCDKFHS